MKTHWSVNAAKHAFVSGVVDQNVGLIAVVLLSDLGEFDKVVGAVQLMNISNRIC